MPSSEGTSTPREGAPTTSTTTESNPQLRSDLAEAIRSKSQLQSRLKTAEAELTKLRAKTKADSESIKELSSLRNVLTLKVKDRDEELRGKAKLLDVCGQPCITYLFKCITYLHSLFQDVQDEMVSLNLQLNMAEQRCKTLETENKELIARWMAHKGREAEEMNKTLR